MQVNNPASTKMKRKTTTLHLRTSSDGRSPLRRGFLLIPLAITLACFALSPTTQAQVDGDLGGGNTAEGAGALGLLNGGFNNTAMGFSALGSNRTGSGNTAMGFDAPLANTTGSDNTATGADALINNTAGNNTATGANALFNNTSGTANTATGVEDKFDRKTFC
jgi:hypothetical protein